MVILGLNRGNHDASACLVKDGEVLSFINVERLTRIKHDGAQIGEGVSYCLECARIDFDEVDLVVQNSYCYDLSEFDALHRSIGIPDDAECVRQFEHVVTISHHLAHAYCGVGLSPFDACAVLVADGVGQIDGDRTEAESGFYFRDLELEEVFQRVDRYPKTDGIHGEGYFSFDSIGGVYSAVASYIFGHWNQSGKVMGLAAYGTENMFGWELISGLNGTLHFNPDFRKDLKHPCKSGRDWERFRKEYENISYAVQDETERALIYLANELYRQTGARNLILSGEVGLNCVANRKIEDATPFERVFVPPVCADDGISVGCAYYGWFEMCKGRKVFALSHPYFGKRYPEDEVLDLLSEEPLISFERVCAEKEAARLLSEGKVVGWFQGRSAMGPRALGNRSILADPGDVKMRDVLNEKVKHREPFRPYGASVLAEKAEEYFECSGERPYMTFAVPVKEEKRGCIPAVVHVDNTCRIQTVHPKENVRFYNLIREFDEITGVPMVINTSFNVKGDPIVETPGDALSCFFATDIDVLFVDDYRVEKKEVLIEGRVNPDILNFHMAARGAFSLATRRIYPSGRVEFAVELESPRQGGNEPVDGEFFEQVSGILEFLNSRTKLKEIFRTIGVDPNSIEGMNLVDVLLDYHKKGLIRFER